MNTAIQIRSATWKQDRQLLLSVREPVFVIEQKVPAEIEIDEHDPLSKHLLALSHTGSPIGTARLLPCGQIGRVAVLKAWRRKGIGSALIEHLVKAAIEAQFPRVHLHAQVSSIPFYESLGFEPFGQIFDEAGIQHREMQKSLLP